MGGGGGETRIRYAPHIEDAHAGLIKGDTAINIIGAFNLAFDQSPYRNFVPLNIKEGYFGLLPGDPTNTYDVKNFPSLFDMYGKFVGGLDLHVLWGDIYEDVLHGPEIANAVTAQSQLLQEELDTTIIPRFLGGMRDINAVNSTTFIIGKANIYRTKVIAINDFQSKLRIAALDLSGKLFGYHAEWSQKAVTLYADLLEKYYTEKMNYDNVNLEYQVKDVLWNMRLFDDVRAMVGALNGAAATEDKAKPSQAVRAIAGAASGAAAGASVGGLYGAAAGAILGAGASFLN